MVYGENVAGPDEVGAPGWPGWFGWWFGWWVLLTTCIGCAALCFVLAAIASYRLAELEAVVNAFNARADELEKRYDGAFRATPDAHGAQSAARQAAAWGAEVLGDMANGVPAGEAVQRSAARMQLPAVREHYAGSDAGSDASRVSELSGFASAANGEDWVARAARSVGAVTPTEGDRALQVHASHDRLTEAAPPIRYRAPLRRPNASPPRGQF